MGDVYQYPVFFECHDLLGEQIKKIENYFRIRRRSGGGDCGPLRSVDGNIYSVAFKHQRDQQAVLQRSEHAVDGLVFTVRGSLEPRASAASQDFTQSPHSIPASTPPPSGEEYVLQLDTYLLRYLKECPKAWKQLEEGLASVASCSAQLYPEKGRVLIRSLAQPGAADEVRNWKAEVDKLFDGYLCHYEVDPHKVKALLQSCSSNQTTDEVKVYSEDCMAVVVGERSQVKARLMDTEDRSGLSEKHTTIRRLGEAKLHLLWKEIEHCLGRDFPGVKVTQGDAGQLVLEGSVEDILKAGDVISDKENLVLERKVSDMSPHFLAFLKKAYEGPGELGDFLEVGDKVEVELRATELRFFTLSAEKLEETEKKLQEKFKEVKIDLPVCSAVPAELWENLKSKTNEMNQGQYRAQVVFGSDSTVCLLGHTKEVEELSEAITEYILDQSVACSWQVATVASYSLRDGLQVLVCQGDITKQDVDALVNAANEDLDDCEGVVAALSKAGGPEVQMESSTIVKYEGKIPAGEARVTTGGNLKCKKLLHAVVGGKAGVRERIVIEKAVDSALKLSEIMEFKSIAMPCISDVCSEAIVTAVKRFGSQGGQSLSTIVLIDDREEVVRAMQEACDRILQGTCTENSAPRHLGFQVDDSAQDDTTGGATAGAPGDGVRLEIIQGTIETQQVDAVVSPMVGHDPLSTRVGNTFFKMVGPQLTATYRKEGGEEMAHGDTVLVEGLTGLPSNAVLFLSLVPWDDDEDGTAVQVLKLGINSILTSCENRGFGSVALPVLGAGIALRFPDSVVARVVLETIHEFEQNRAGRTPLLVRIVIHPSDEDSSEAFKSAYKAFQLKGFIKEAHQPDQVSSPKRIILLGKTGSGKSSLANTIFGETLFTTNHSPNSGTSECQTETKSVDGRSITLIDTPGFFDARRSEEDLKPEIVRCITECAPGPHAFLIVLKVEKFTEQEQAVITKICQYFSEDALKYAVIVFTHGEQLPKGMKIEEFVSQNKNLSDLVQRCGGRCHVVDNRYWKNKQQNSYRSNQSQVENLLNTIDKMVMDHNGGYYINKMLQAVEEEIQNEEAQIRQSSGNMPEDEIRKQAKSRASQRFLIQLAGIATGALLGAFFGITEMARLVLQAVQTSSPVMKLLKSPAVGGAAAAAVGGGEVALIAAGIVVGVGAAAAGGALGGIIGRDAAEGAETPMEAAERAANAVINKGKTTLRLT